MGCNSNVIIWTASGTTTIDHDGPVSLATADTYGPASPGTLYVNVAAVVAVKVAQDC